MMNTLLRVIPTCALLAACSGSAAPVATPSGASQTPFPGGDQIQASELTATPAVLPAAPPAYPNSGITRQQLARFAWRQFIYLNSPAKPNGVTAVGKTPVVRGTIDPNRSFAASGDAQFYQKGQSASNFGSNALVWETFAHRTELLPASFPPRTILPSLGLTGDFPNLDPRYAFSIKDVNANPIGSFTVESKDARFNNLDETTQIGQNQIFFPKPGASPSNDDYLVLFEAKVNQTEYDYIQSKCDGRRPGHSCGPSNLPASIELPPNAENPAESIEVKAAWREMPPELISSGRYHTAEALYYKKGDSNTPQANVKTFGLVGLHILRKMKNYPAFVYTTFEHVDNLSNSGLYYITLYDQMRYTPLAHAPQPPSPTAIVNTGVSHVQIALPLAGPVDQAHRYPFVPGSVTVTQGFAGPISVVPSPAVTVAVSQVNREVHELLTTTPAFQGSVWQYYQLAGIQILPTNEDGSITAPLKPLTEDFYLANNVVESSQPGIQLFKGAVMDPGPPTIANSAGLDMFVNERAKPNIVQLNTTDNITGTTDYSQTVMGGCMGCHGNAQYPRDPTTHSGPSIFNFLITADTLSGNGLAAETRDENPNELRAQGRRYLK